MAIKPLSEAIRETREWLEINGSPDATASDALEDLLDECGQDASGYCHYAGTEYCDFECPFSG
jgi:hypothetical protein